MNRSIKMFSILLLIAAIPGGLTSCGGAGATAPPPNTTTQAVTVSITPLQTTVSPSTSQTFTATVAGSVTDKSVLWKASGGSFSGAGSAVTYAAPSNPGTYTVTATSVADPAKAASATVTVSAPPSSVTVSITPISATLTAGATQTLTAAITGSSNTAVTWTATAGAITPSGTNASYTAPSTPGSYTVTATSVADSTKSASATITVSAPPPSMAVSITPTSLTLQTGASQLLTATISSNSSTEISGTSTAEVTWTATGGTITASGNNATYTAPTTPGTYTVTATSVTDPTKSASATIVVSAPPATVAVAITPTSVTLQTSAKQTLTATVSGSTDIAVTWSATAGTITTSGADATYTAPSTAGTYTVTATSVTDPTKSASATITVSAPPAVITVSLSPASTVLAPGGNQFFTATVTGSSVTDLSWNVSGGSLSGNGNNVVYTAPVTPGMYVVTVTSTLDPTKKASASVEVQGSALMWLFPVVSTVPVRGIQSLSAQLSIPGEVRWTASGGQIIGSGNTIGFCATTPGTYTVTATSAADSSISASTIITVTPPPAPRTDHPRIWITSADLPRLRSWASSSNPMWQNGVIVAASYATNLANQHWSWSFQGGTGTPDSGWKDDGGVGYAPNTTEAYAEYFAFLSLVHPDQSQRDTYAKMSRDMLMWMINQAAQGPADAPFRYAGFAVHNRASGSGGAFGRIVDWIYPYLTAADKTNIQKAFLMWGKTLLNAATTGGDHPAPIGVTNDLQLIGDKYSALVAANNYYTAHMAMLTFMSLALDPADDPAVNPAISWDRVYSDGSANSVRAYLKNVTGAWLYKQYAIFEDSKIVEAAYNTSNPFFGMSAGGTSEEGFLYNISQGMLFGALLALRSTGNDDPAVHGPQVNLLTSSYWDGAVNGLLHSLTPTNFTDSQSPWMGKLWPMFGYGDLQHLYVLPEHANLFLGLGIQDQTTGNTQRLGANQWIATNAIQGGAEKLYSSRVGGIWGNNYSTLSLMHFMVFDPNTNPTNAADPRTTLPKEFNDSPVGRLLARTDWTQNASIFSHLCTKALIDHQTGTCGQFDFFRKGEWLIKARDGYNSDGVAPSPDYHNIPAYQNDPNVGGLAWYSVATSQRGGQFYHTQQQGDATSNSSVGNNYVYAFDDTTKLYNKYNPWDSASSAMLVSHASRSIFWLKPDVVVTYDRGATTRSGLFKKNWLTVTAEPIITGQRAVVNTPGGQQVTIQALLPVNASMTSLPVESYASVADYDPVRFRIMITDSSNPAEIRFLNVIQGADAGAAAIGTQLVQSTAGTAFEGAVVGQIAVMFIKNVPDTESFSTTTYTVPDSVSSTVISGLIPGAGYTVSVSRNNGMERITIAAGGSLSADNAGVLKFSQ